MLEKFSTVSVSIGPESFQLTSFKDVYSEFSQHYDEGDGFEEPPLYGILWPSAEGLAWSLWQNHSEALKGARVLEIGCGLALPSLLAARLGADVLAMDNHTNFPKVLSENMTANGVACQASVGSFADPKLNLGEFDWIIGSDILYEPDLYPELERFLVRHAKPNARVIIADPGRYAASKFGASLKGNSRYTKVIQKIPSGQEIDLYRFDF
ncbi:MAG: hypothetical protein EOP10_14740 [Proteobacteria bacterium]|nr:MAG: hypothetical protein EOP10_14740 [Pseudomonadota bacterium]